MSKEILFYKKEHLVSFQLSKVKKMNQIQKKVFIKFILLQKNLKNFMNLVKASTKEILLLMFLQKINLKKQLLIHCLQKKKIIFKMSTVAIKLVKEFQYRRIYKLKEIHQQEITN